MADQDITYDDVAAAAAGLQDDGSPVTLEAVRAVVGGSPNAVYKHLSAWRLATAKPVEPPRAELPEALLSGLAEWALQFAHDAGAAEREALAQSDADREVLAAVGEELEAERDGLRTELADVTGARDDALALLAERDETIERLNAELRNARQVAMDALVSKAKDQLAIEGKDSQLAALRAEIERNVAAQAAESDRRLAAEMELVGATTARTALESENAELRKQLEAARSKR
ncbi:DNA-binding protein [uncultured Massilia sp.]|uniref:DNA-binding protein n=1 Tax=uncultured Massilia sp. TaxID=169973 RepID=UPI0025FD2655|nr:DNA-binding protein [uncultured Massilia sp.]